ncbi:uncharacterized protein Z518_08436 [Rhinocladiella mackenziei CBS 650.93]|uniref:Uncharacterized protein n=1 Tax=Rhinocladiella mackenziei CBS 650.93 TaxID=1442369 RepID=A0A0D2J0U4_9EURO|nr:uncharacterized protein Z518_08436 [Rhinocladiella mackenziei CBS 650.93]KIX02495.1 hypothetical protein Z518_08436 [Rhinocladiella mackenziei CBS 650.93]
MDSALLVDNNMESISPNRLKCAPTPLHPLSPERINQQRQPQSPSLHGYLVESERPQTRDSFNSDVQSKVAFLNSLTANASAQSSPARAGRLGGATLSNTHSNGNIHPSNNANANNALQRAVMGYEEAQASLATLTAELERAKEELTSRKKREKLLSQRVEDLLEELQAEKEKRARDQESYAKEIKRCRKETYRAELAVVASRQDLQEVRGELKRSQAEVQHEKTEKEKSRQESFERAYALAGMIGEMEQLKDQLTVVEKERDAALLEAKAGAIEKSAVLEHKEKNNSRSVEEEEEIPPSSTTVDENGTESAFKSTTVSERTPVEAPTQPLGPRDPTFASIKFCLEYYDKQIEGQEVTLAEEVEFLKQELNWARKRHAEDEDLIHFMHMQCQFNACPCRLAESNGERFIHDHGYEASVQEQRASKKKRISNEDPGEHVAADNGASAQDTPKATRRTREFTRLPPEPTPELLSTAADPQVLEQAVGIPLPEPQPMELDPKADTPESTAHLEDITQVLVEPGTASKPFSFSTSITSNPGFRTKAPPLRPVENASVALDHDLFDLSPPKQAPPRRPSTAMGIVTLGSPIRLVPDSPRSVRTSHREARRSKTPTNDRHHTMTQSITTTTKVALKDSPPRSLHRRTQSKPNLRSHSPLVSSVMSHAGDSNVGSGFAHEASASPAAHTVFPVTPLHHSSRSMHNLAQHAQTQARPPNRSPPQAIATTTTTTRVPLRGFADTDDDVFSPDHDAQAEGPNVNTRLNSTVNEMGSHRQTDTVTTSILGNIPGTPISREAALAQIRARRDRARSVNLKRSVEGSGNSSSTMGSKSPRKPGAVNGGLLAKDKQGAKREISQASAPGRIAF